MGKARRYKITDRDGDSIWFRRSDRSADTVVVTADGVDGDLVVVVASFSEVLNALERLSYEPGHEQAQYADPEAVSQTVPQGGFDG